MRAANRALVALLLAGAGCGGGAPSRAGGGAAQGDPAAPCAGAPSCSAPDGGPPDAAPRDVQFTDGGDGTVTVREGLGPLVWLRDPSCADDLGGVARRGGPVPWSQAVAWTGALGAGACGLADGSAPGAWRLPTPSELLHLQVDLAAPNPFAGVQSGICWTSFWHSGRVAAVDLSTGESFEYPEDSLFGVWPVRAPTVGP